MGGSEQRKRNLSLYSNLPHSGSATGSGRAEHVGEEEVVVVGFKELLGKGGIKRQDVVEVSG